MSQDLTPDVAAFDLDEDAQPDTVLLDANADAVADVVVLDLDEDAVPDAAVVDTDADAIADYAVINLDEEVAEQPLVPTDAGVTDEASAAVLDEPADDVLALDEPEEDADLPVDDAPDDGGGSLTEPPDVVTNEDLDEARGDLEHSQLMNTYMESRGVI